MALLVPKMPKISPIHLSWTAGPQGFDQAPAGRPIERREGMDGKRRGGKGLGQSGQRTALQRLCFASLFA